MSNTPLAPHAAIEAATKIFNSKNLIATINVMYEDANEPGHFHHAKFTFDETCIEFKVFFEKWATYQNALRLLQQNDG